MIDKTKIIDVVIIGGGLAGLCLSIQLAKKGHSVVVLEKNSYPNHKVCGEYISMESWNFLLELGLNLPEMNLPIISKINITAHDGYTLSGDLDLGGFGVSRYTIDNELFEIAKTNGVTVIENCRASNVLVSGGNYTIETNLGNFNAKLACGSYGKVEPAFIAQTKHNSKGKYLGVKYHIKTTFPSNLIELHNFKDGYCGISKVDANTYCLCYLTTTKNLQDNNNDIKQMEKNVLMQNPHLRKYFSESVFVFEKPVAISQIGFQKKTTYQNNILLLGDAAGAIAPLCGNGMSIAMRSSKIISRYISEFLMSEISKTELINGYEKEWNRNFSFRIKTGYYLQYLFGKKYTTLLTLKILNASPRFFRKIISLTHGKTF